jgi:hypothetical protein
MNVDCGPVMGPTCIVLSAFVSIASHMDADARRLYEALLGQNRIVNYERSCVKLHCDIDTGAMPREPGFASCRRAELMGGGACLGMHRPVCWDAVQLHATSGIEPLP